MAPPGAERGARGHPPRPVTSVPVSATVHTPAYDGPVDVLLQLVNSHQVDIFDIPLAEVVDAFVAEMASWAEVDLSPEAVKADYEVLAQNGALQEKGGLTAALLAFLEVCARHGLGLEGGEGARAMRPTPKIQRPF